MNIGELVGHYRVVELLGRGNMGVVYKALDVNLDRLVAIKVMSAEVRDDPDFVERFRQEARVQGALNHPNVALLFDYFVHDGAPVAVMEYIVGESLEQVIRRRGPIPAHEGIPIFKQALRGVAAAHRAGIIHRDLKPANLMITQDEIVKVMDFGIAKRQGMSGATKVSTSIGSPLYMAPEQILGRAVDYRTDVYALGITLYELLSGQPPFNPRDKSEYILLSAHVNDRPEPPTVHCRDIPQPIADAVMRALAKEPDARFQSAEDFMGALADVPAPRARAPVRSAAAPRVTASGTVVLDRPTATLRLDSSPRESAPSPAVSATPVVAANAVPAGAPINTQAGDDSTRSSLPASPVAQELRAALPPRMQLRQAAPLAIVAALGTVLVLGALVRHAQRLHAIPRNALLVSSGVAFTQAQAPPSTPTPTQVSTEPAAPPPALPAITPPVESDLSGTWRGEYVDASGKQLLRVVSLSISRVYDDGGIEGTLQYAAPSGDGECKLHPRDSSYSAGEQRLQLRPEGCSPHYPKELGVPLDFDGVNPQMETLEDGRIEAPTGEAIRVNLRR